MIGGPSSPPLLIRVEMKRTMNKTNENIDWAKYSWNPGTGAVIRAAHEGVIF